MKITVTRQADDLHRETWTFELIVPYGMGSGLCLCLDRYEKEYRPTRRHKFQATDWYNRLELRRSAGMDIKAADVPWPDDVLGEARQAVVSLALVMEISRE